MTLNMWMFDDICHAVLGWTSQIQIFIEMQVYMLSKGVAMSKQRTNYTARVWEQVLHCWD